MKSPFRHLAVLGLLAIPAWPSVSAAQGAPPAGAAPQASGTAQAAGAAPQTAEDRTAAEVRALFQEGLTHQKAGRWPEAERAYLAAWQKKRTHDIAANLALVSMELKKHVQAAELFAFALRNYPAGGSPAKRADMESAFKQSKANVGTLRISVNVEDARISVNGVERGKSPLQEEVYVAPGPYVVSIRREGYVAVEQKGTVDKGAAASVAAALEREKPAPVPTTTTTAPPSTAPPPPRSMVPAYVVGGIGAISLITGGVLVGVAASTGGDLKSDAPRGPDGSLLCRKTPDPAASATAECDAWRGRLGEASTLGNTGIGLIIVSILAGAGAAGYALWPSSTSRQSSLIWYVSPLLSQQGGGASLHGRF